MTIHIQRAGSRTLQLAAGTGQVGTIQRLDFQPDGHRRLRLDAWSARTVPQPRGSEASTALGPTSVFALDPEDVVALRDWLTAWLEADHLAPTPPAAPAPAPAR